MIKVKEDNIFNIKSLPENWKLCKLEDAVNIIGGSQPPKKTFKTEYENGYVRLIQIRDYKSDRFLTYVPIISTKKFCLKNDVMIGRYGPPVFQILRGLEGAYNVALMKAEPKNNMYSEYLFHLLSSKPVQDLVINNSQRTAGQTGVNLRLLNNCLIPLPPISKQQKIANILDAADALRQNDKALIAKYDELTQALFLDMFGDPVSNPKGWEMKIMTNVCEKISVGFVGVCEPHYTDKDNGIPMLRTGNLGEGFLKYDKMKYVTEEFHLKQKKSRLYKDDILIARHGDNGKAVLYKGEYQEANCLNIIILRPAKGLLNGTYNVYMLNNESTRNKILGKTGGATQKVVNTKEIQKLIVPIPPIGLQNQFAERVAVIEEQKAIAQKSLEKSEELFNSLLQRAFKGELV